MPKSTKEHIEEEINSISALYDQDKAKEIEYLQNVLRLPWDSKVESFWDIVYSQEYLDKSHYGLQDVKERIIQLISKCKRCSSDKGMVLLMTGPPGVGKTSIAKSIAACLKRPYAIVSMSGQNDTTHIKGSKRTYVSAQPGIFIKEMQKLGINNPVIIVDEIDKIETNAFNQNISSSLLEILNTEQNNEFVDYYLDIPFDFSKCIFICTSNTTRNLLKPFLDRVEVINIRAYLPQEKVVIAQKYLIPAILAEHKVNSEYCNIEFSPSTINYIITQYCSYESGVRNLRKCIDKIIRKIVFQIETHKELVLKNKQMIITPEYARKLLGTAPSEDTQYYKNIQNALPIGCANSVICLDESVAQLLKIQLIKLPTGDGKSQFSIHGSVGPVLVEGIEMCKVVCGNFIIRKFGASYINMYEKSLMLHLSISSLPKNESALSMGIAVSLISMIMDKPVNQGRAFIGELDMNESILKAGMEFTR